MKRTKDWCRMNCSVNGVMQMECRICRPANRSALEVFLLKLWLFLGIVFRDWHGMVMPKTAWEVAGMVWGKKDVRR